MSGRGRPTGLRFEGNSEVVQAHQPRADFSELAEDKLTLGFGEQFFVKAVEGICSDFDNVRVDALNLILNSWCDKTQAFKFIQHGLLESCFRCLNWGKASDSTLCSVCKVCVKVNETRFGRQKFIQDGFLEKVFEANNFDLYDCLTPLCSSREGVECFQENSFKNLERLLEIMEKNENNFKLIESILASIFGLMEFQDFVLWICDNLKWIKLLLKLLDMEEASNCECMAAKVLTRISKFNRGKKCISDLDAIEEVSCIICTCSDDSVLQECLGLFANLTNDPVAKVHFGKSIDLLSHLQILLDAFDGVNSQLILHVVQCILGVVRHPVAKKFYIKQGMLELLEKVIGHYKERINCQLSKLICQHAELTIDLLTWEP